MDAADLGHRLRAERTAAGRTIASVAADAGLSVPYIANLENGRGNPTLAALSRLADALGVRLDVALAPPGDAEPEPALSPTVRQFARSARFRAEAERLGGAALLAVLTAAQAACPELSTLDCHRLLDAVVLAHRR